MHEWLGQRGGRGGGGAKEGAKGEQDAGDIDSNQDSAIMEHLDGNHGVRYASDGVSVGASAFLLRKARQQVLHTHHTIPLSTSLFVDPSISLPPSLPPALSRSDCHHLQGLKDLV